CRRIVIERSGTFNRKTACIIDSCQDLEEAAVLDIFIRQLRPAAAVRTGRQNRVLYKDGRDGSTSRTPAIRRAQGSWRCSGRRTPRRRRQGQEEINFFALTNAVKITDTDVDVRGINDLCSSCGDG